MILAKGCERLVIRYTAAWQKGAISVTLKNNQDSIIQADIMEDLLPDSALHRLYW